jgi:hypothetical protein
MGYHIALFKVFFPCIEGFTRGPIETPVSSLVKRGRSVGGTSTALVFPLFLTDRRTSWNNARMRFSPQIGAKPGEILEN